MTRSDPANVSFLQNDQTGRTVMVGSKKSPDLIMTEAFGRVYLDYRQAWNLAENFALETDWPLHLDVDVNVSCNLGCIMCPLGQNRFPVKYENKLLDFELFERVLREGAAKSLASIRLGVTGEPLLRKDIVGFIRLAHNLGLTDIMLITNGLLLTPGLSRELMDAGLTRLMVSLDAARPETYARLRPGGDFGRTVKNVLDFLQIREARRHALPLLRVSFVRMSLNNDEKEEFQSFWEGKADYIGFQEYADIMENGDKSLFPPDRKTVEDFRCREPWQRMSLFVNGDLFPCCSDFGRLAPLGNANESTVEQVWKSEPAQNLRRIHQQGRWREYGVCRRCAKASTGKTD